MANAFLEDLQEQSFTEQTVRRMYDLVNRAKTDAEFQKLIYGLVNHAMPGQWKDYKRELSTVFNWFKRNVDYRRDPHGVELLQDVWATLDRKRGDCDDATVFLAAAAEVLGSPARIITVSTRPNKEPNHVYAEALVGGRWQGLDATVPQSYVGWAPANVTARRIWTRKELGLSGGDDEEGIEGLGMSENNGYGRDGFGTNMRPVSQALAPGIPDDIAHTYGAPIPGTDNITKRKIWNAPVANNSDWTSNPRPGGGVYGPALPIAKRPLPQDLWYLVDRKFVPKVLDPDSAWWGKVPTSQEDLNAMFPGSEGTMATYLRDVASVPSSAISEVTEDVRTQLAMGEIGLGDVGAAIEEGLEDYALGLAPRMKRPPGQRGPRTLVGKGGPKGAASRTMPRPLHERRYLIPAPRVALVPASRPMIKGGSLNGLGDLGDAITDAAAALSAGIQTGSVPPSAVNQAINSIVSTITGQPAGTPVTTSTVAKAAIPVGMIALLGAAAWLMTRGGQKSYRRNPGRRRSRGRRGGGFDIKTAALWGAGGLAAYFLLLRPGGILMPAPITKPAVPVIPGMTAQQQAAIAAGVKAVPSIFDSIAKLFGGSSSTSAPSSSTAPKIITSYDQPYAPSVLPSSSPSPSMITSYDQLSAPAAPSSPSSDWTASLVV